MKSKNLFVSTGDFFFIQTKKNQTKKIQISTNYKLLYFSYLFFILCVIYLFAVFHFSVVLFRLKIAYFFLSI